MAVLALGALQLDPLEFTSADEFKVGVTARVSSLVRKGASLVVLPEYTPMILAWHKLECPATDLHGLGLRMEDRLLEDCMDFFAALSLSHHIHVCAGSVITPRASGVINSSLVFSPQGNLLQVQGQTHASPSEHSSGLICSTNLSCMSVGGSAVGICLGTDIWYPEVCRILALMGADVILAPNAVPAPYTLHHQLRGLWQEVQQNQVYGVEACLIGEFLGVRYEGRTAVLAPVEMTAGGEGVVARAASTTGPAELVVSLDTDKLHGPRRSFPIFRHLNIGLYETDLIDLYRAGDAVSVAIAHEKGDSGP